MEQTEIRLDKTTIFILKSTTRSLVSAENFLKTRGWTVFSSIDLLETITMLLEKQPHYFMLCYDHPSQKALQLPRLLQQIMLPITTINYLERESAANISKMQASGNPHQIFPPVSGPAIERAILKIEKELSLELAQSRKIDRNGNQELFEVPMDMKNALQMFFSTADDEENSEFDPENYGVSASTLTHLHFAAKEDPSKDPQPPAPLATPKTETKRERKNDLKKDSIIVTGTELALGGSVNSNPSEKIQKIEASSNCVCITVESTRFNGYLVAAMGKNRVLDAEFVANVQKRLFAFLRSQGETISDDDGCEVKLKQVEFEDWALEQADFLKKSIHNGNEVAMAFFPTDKAAPEITGEEGKKMLQLNIDDLEGDKEVNFNVYVHLPANNKYVLMTPKGGIFLSEQKDRLKKKGVAKMHMRQEEIRDVKQYKAQNYLNSKIDEFHQKKSETPNNSDSKNQGSPESDEKNKTENKNKKASGQ